jgi:hypothetical protein
MTPLRRRIIQSLYKSCLTLAAEQLLGHFIPESRSGLFASLVETAASLPVFSDVTDTAGLAQAQIVCGESEKKRFLLEMTGCGLAFFDYDQDGWIDLFLVNGTRFQLDPSQAPPGNYLFHNNRDGTFTEVTAKAGLVHSGWGQGCCIGDYDNDGFDDLFVTYWGDNALFRNLGNGTFADVTRQAGLSLGRLRRWNTGCCFLDYDRDGHLDLFVANYIQFDPKDDPGAGASDYCRLKGFPVACGPRGFNGGTNLLFRNRGDGTFEDVTLKSGIGKPAGPQSTAFTSANWKPRGTYGFGAVSADFDNDGWPDIYVACDSAPSLLYRNNHDGSFREVGVAAGCAYNEDGIEQAGMGAAAADYDGDGWIDIVKTNFSDDTSSLYHNLGQASFEELTFASGIGLNTQFLGWGAGFIDVDNDGWKDLFVANGHIYPGIDRQLRHLRYHQRNLLYKNIGNGKFLDISMKSGPGLRLEKSSRGCAFGDFDNDGDMDVLISNINDAPTLLRNDSPAFNWIKVKCLGTVSNRSAIGTRVRVSAGSRVQIDEVQSGSSYLSQNDLRLHFGVGEADRIDRLEVRWPTGKIECFAGLQVNRLYTLEEGRGIARVIELRG